MSYNYVHSTLDVRVGRGALDIALPLRVLYTYDSHSATRFREDSTVYINTICAYFTVIFIL